MVIIQLIWRTRVISDLLIFEWTILLRGLIRMVISMLSTNTTLLKSARLITSKEMNLKRLTGSTPKSKLGISIAPTKTLMCFYKGRETLLYSRKITLILDMLFKDATKQFERMVIQNVLLKHS